MRTRLLILFTLLSLVAAACSGGTTSNDGEGDVAAGEGSELDVGGTSATDEATTAADSAPEATSEDSAPAGDGETVVVGSIHPLTGGLALDGTQMDNAVKLAVDDINAAGDLGVTLEVASADTQGEPELGQSEAQRLVDEGAVALIGAFQSAVTTNIATVAARQQVPLIIDVAVSDAILSGENEFVFRIQPNATSMGQYGAEYLRQLADINDLEIETVGYMHEQTDFGTSVFDAFSANAEANGLEVVADVSYDAFAGSDYTTELQQIVAAEPDVLVVTGYYNDGITIAQNVFNIKPDLQAVYGVANGAFDLPSFPADAGEAAPMFLDSNYHFDATNERVTDIRARFETEYGDAMRTAAVLAYQSVEVLAAALAEVEDPTDSVAIAEAIRGVTVDDPLMTYPGPIEFDEAGENINARPVVMQVQGEEILQVFPEEFAEAEPQFPAIPWDAP